MSKRAVHDLGGLPGGPIDRHEHVPTMTERRIDAMMVLLRDGKRHLWTTDENRRAVESMLPEMYEGAAYYERWVHGMRTLLIEKGVLAEAEVEQRLAEVRSRFAPSAAAAGGAGASAAKPSGKPAGKPKRAAAVAKTSRTRAGARVKGEPPRDGKQRDSGEQT